MTIEQYISLGIDKVTALSGISASNTNGQGHFIASSIGSNTDGYIDGSSVVSASETHTLQNSSICIGAVHRGVSPAYYSSRELGPVTIGKGLTSTEAALLSSAIIQFQTDLSRL